MAEIKKEIVVSRPVLGLISLMFLAFYFGDEVNLVAKAYAKSVTTCPAPEGSEK